LIQDLLAVGSISGLAPAKKAGVFGPGNEFFYTGQSTFVNYGGGVLRGCLDCGLEETDGGQRQGGYSIRFQGQRFVNSTKRTAWTVPFNQIFLDLDGSLTGVAQGTVIPYSPFNDFNDPTSGCSRAGPTYDGGILCDSSESVRRLVVDGVNPRELDFMPMAVVSAAGTGVVRFKPREEYGWVTPVVMRRVYRLFFKAVPEFHSMRLKVGEPEYLGQGEWVGLCLNFTNKRSYYKTAIAAANGSFVVPVSTCAQPRYAVFPSGVLKPPKKTASNPPPALLHHPLPPSHRFPTPPPLLCHGYGRYLC
jgi:hypothetical protein